MPGLAAPNRSVVRVDLVLRSFWDLFNCMIFAWNVDGPFLFVFRSCDARC